MASEIYAVANFGAIRMYVGEVRHLKTRWPKMMKQLDQGIFPDSAIQAEWTQYSNERRFTFHTSEEVRGETRLRGRKLFLKDIEKSPPQS